MKAVWELIVRLQSCCFCDCICRGRCTSSGISLHTLTSSLTVALSSFHPFFNYTNPRVLHFSERQGVFCRATCQPTLPPTPNHLSPQQLINPPLRLKRWKSFILMMTLNFICLIWNILSAGMNTTRRVG